MYVSHKPYKGGCFVSYSKSIFFIPVWFDHFKPFVKSVSTCPLWKPTDSKKVWACYLFRYASDLNRNKDHFASFTLLDPSAINVYMFEDELAKQPLIEEVRLSCFSTGVGFMEFWVSHSGFSVDEVTDFAYMFKKATSKYKKRIARWKTGAV